MKKKDQIWKTIQPVCYQIWLSEKCADVVQEPSVFKYATKNLDSVQVPFRFTSFMMSLLTVFHYEAIDNEEIKTLKYFTSLTYKTCVSKHPLFMVHVMCLYYFWLTYHTLWI